MYAFTILLSAFLLFQIQPMISKWILPWFGGTPAVWTVCMLFFQVALFGGYGYAHLLASRLSPRRQAIVHGALLTVSALVVLVCSIAPAQCLRPGANDEPILRIFLILTLSVGLPYFTLSSTSPLLQAWYGRLRPGKEPYVFYALSNVGSFLALLTYPFVIEPQFALPTQAWIWGGGYFLFAGAACVIAFGLKKHAVESASPAGDRREPEAVSNPDAPGVLSGSRRGELAWWIVLPMVASTMLLAVTNQLCMDVASVPFLWILPLSIYLVTFILTFSGWPVYWRPGCLVIIAATAGMILAMFLFPGRFPLYVQIPVYCLELGAVCLAAHGELYRLRPGQAGLTKFYLAIAGGGALGGIFVGIVAPAIFRMYYEFHLAVGAMAVLMLVLAWRERPSARGVWGHGLAGVGIGLLLCLAAGLFWNQELFGLARMAELIPARLFSHASHPVDAGPLDGMAKLILFGPSSLKPIELWTALPLTVALLAWIGCCWVERRSPAGGGRWHRFFGAGAILCLLLVVSLGLHTRMDLTKTVEIRRNFFGVTRVREIGDEVWGRHFFAMLHGSTQHGMQYAKPPLSLLPTSYFSSHSGIAAAFREFPRREPARVGVLGLGVGTLAAYARSGDHYRFYEINSDITDLAQDPRFFSYLAHAREIGATVEIVPGDARLSLERELEEGKRQEFDLLALDAFSSDSIPVHLITREALALYLKQLKPDGVLAVNVTNRHLNMLPVVTALARHYKLTAYFFSNDAILDKGVSSAQWVLLTSSPVFIGKYRPVDLERAAQDRRTILWTDDCNNLFGVLKKRSFTFW